MKKQLITMGAITASIAPIAVAVSCAGTKNKEQPLVEGKGGVFTEYVRAHDLVLSLGVAPKWHARSDLSTTHDKINEGYLDAFSNEFTQNGKRYNGGDREYYASLNISNYIARKIDDSKGYFENVKYKTNVINSDEIEDKLSVNGHVNLNWKGELTKLAKGFDGKSTNYQDRAEKVLSQWNPIQDKLEKDAKAMTTDKTVIVVRGTDKTDANEAYDGIIPSAHMSEMYGLDHISFPILSGEDKAKLTIASYLIKGKNATSNNADLKQAFSGKADIVIYLKTPGSTVGDDEISNELKSMSKTDDKSSVLVRSYDNWYLPFRGAAIGANVAYQNIEKDVIANPDYVANDDWKKLYNPANLNKIQ